MTLKVSAEGTEEEHARARAIGAAYGAGYGQARIDIANALPEVLEWHLADVVGEDADWDEFSRQLMRDMETAPGNRLRQSSK